MFQDNLFREFVVDNFAGGGGASTGMELALGYPVDIAVNHDADAIAMHKVNHPYTRHFQEDVFAIDPEQVTGGRAVGIAWFSPDCKHFSRAKGGKPVDKKIRGLSWVVLRWAMSSVAPRVIFMENVPEIKTWCPLIEIDGQMRPDPAREGETFNGFVAMLTGGIEKEHPAFSEACEFLKIEPDSEEGDRLAAVANKQLADALDKAREENKMLRLQIFAFVRNSAVLPVGRRLNKSEQEITDKTFETIEAAKAMIDVEAVKAAMNLATNKENRFDNAD